MGHGSKVFPALIVFALGFGGFAKSTHGREPADDRLGERTVPIILLTRSDVQADLKLKPEQVAECHRAALEFQRKASLLRGRRDPGAVAARGEIDGALSQWLSAHLAPDQLGRLEQIDLQWEGAGAMLNRPFLDDALSLTPSQKQKVVEFVAQSKALRARGTWTYNDHTNLTRQALAILTDKQRELWVRLLGPQCKFTIVPKVQTSPGQPVARGNSNPTSPLR
jgi:hypothetical protein